MFILQNAPKDAWQLPGLDVSWLPVHTGTAKHDLIVWLKSEPALEVALEYSTDLFDAATMKRILDDYQSILAAMAKDPGALVSAIPISNVATPKIVEISLPPAAAKSPTTSRGRELVEARLIELWEAAFGLHPIRADQNFFELGGDSLLAARLFTQIEKAFKIKLPLATLVESPTIAQLAGDSFRSDNPFVEFLPRRGPAQRNAAPLSSVCMATAVRSFTAGTCHVAWEPTNPCSGCGPKGSARRPRTIRSRKWRRHYLKEIRCVQPHGPYYLGGYCFGGMVAYEMARLLTAQGEKVAMLAMFNTPAPGSLDGWPLQQTYLAKRITHELRKLGELGTRDKLEVLGTKAAGLGRLALGSIKETIWKISAKSPLGRAEKWTQRLVERFRHQYCGGQGLRSRSVCGTEHPVSHGRSVVALHIRPEIRLDSPDHRRHRGL